MAAASSPTVTDSGSLISSRLISTGGSGGPGSGLGSRLTSTFGGAAGAAGAAAAAGRTGGAGAAGRAGAGGAPGRRGTAGVTAGGAPGTARRGGAAGPAAAGGIAGRGWAGIGEGGRVGRRSVGSFLSTVGTVGGATGDATTGVGSGTGGGAGSESGGAVWRISVAAGLISPTGSATRGSAGSISATFLRAVLGAVPGAFFFAASWASPGSALALGTRLGLASSGRSRPRPSLTRSSLAAAACSGLIARIPFWPIASRATIRSLLVTPSSFARSMTLTLAATAGLPPHLIVHGPAAQNRRHARCGRLAGPFERMPEPARAESLAEAFGVGTHVGAPPPRRTTVINVHPPVRTAHEPEKRRLRPDLPASDAGPLGRRRHSAEVLATLSGGASSSTAWGAASSAAGRAASTMSSA